MTTILTFFGNRGGDLVPYAPPEQYHTLSATSQGLVTAFVSFYGTHSSLTTEQSGLSPKENTTLKNLYQRGQADDGVRRIDGASIEEVSDRQSGPHHSPNSLGNSWDTYHRSRSSSNPPVSPRQLERARYGNQPRKNPLGKRPVRLPASSRALQRPSRPAVSPLSPSTQIPAIVVTGVGKSSSEIIVQPFSEITSPVSEESPENGPVAHSVPPRENKNHYSNKYGQALPKEAVPEGKSNNEAESSPVQPPLKSSRRPRLTLKTDGLSNSKRIPASTVRSQVTNVMKQLKHAPGQPVSKTSAEIPKTQPSTSPSLEPFIRPTTSISAPASPAPRSCIACTEDMAIYDFPSRPTSRCNHTSNTCKSCLEQWIGSELESKGWDKLSCPECKAAMDYADVHQFASPKVFQRYDALVARSALSAIPNFHWCIGPGCQSGQIHEAGTSGPIFRCAACGFTSCLKHKKEWHKGETCEQYDYRTNSGKRRAAEEKASLKKIQETTKKCPGAGCGRPIEKSTGCDHMTCTRCRHEFCWVCFADYDPIRKRGNSAHRPTCKYHSKNIPGRA